MSKWKSSGDCGLRVFLLMVMYMCTVGSSEADPFQFVKRDTGAFVSYSAVSIDDKLVGYTDMYGRIDISRPPGQYTCTIGFLGKTFTVSLKISGDTKLKPVPLTQ
jgi:hypothetical protein